MNKKKLSYDQVIKGGALGVLVYLCDTYGISKEYFDSIFDIDKRALKGENGIFTHNSVRHDKSDIYPCPRMIEMLKNL